MLLFCEKMYFLAADAENQNMEKKGDVTELFHLFYYLFSDVVFDRNKVVCNRSKLECFDHHSTIPVYNTVTRSTRNDACSVHYIFLVVSL